MAQGISIREFARRDGCSDTLVRRAIKDGYLPTFEDGTLDPALAGTPWRKGNNAPANSAANTANTSSHPANKSTHPLTEADADALAADLDEFVRRVLAGEFVTLAEAERVKENALALKQVLAVRRDAGEVVDLEQAERVVFEEFRGQRDAWMTWPSRIGPMLAADLGMPADKVVDVLTKHVHQHLADLGGGEPDISGKA